MVWPHFKLSTSTKTVFPKMVIVTGAKTYFGRGTSFCYVKVHLGSPWAKVFSLKSWVSWAQICLSVPIVSSLWHWGAHGKPDLCANLMMSFGWQQVGLVTYIPSKCNVFMTTTYTFCRIVCFQISTNYCKKCQKLYFQQVFLKVSVNLIGASIRRCKLIIWVLNG